MPARFKPLFRIVAACASCWPGAIRYWRAGHRARGTGDLVAWLRALPRAAACARPPDSADTDHRGNRTMERIALVSNRFKQLDADAGLASVGTASSSGAASYLTALARHAVGARAAALLRIGNLDPLRRDAALLAPGTEV
jgi:hypothetical protein